MHVRQHIVNLADFLQLKHVVWDQAEDEAWAQSPETRNMPNPTFHLMSHLPGIWPSKLKILDCTSIKNDTRV